jgi:hypothetical protein
MQRSVKGIMSLQSNHEQNDYFKHGALVRFGFAVQVMCLAPQCRWM